MKNHDSFLRTGVSAWVLLLPAASFFVQPASAALRSWTGAGGDANWGTAANWAPAGIPQEGDDLVFPAGAARLVNTNSLAFRRFNSITFNGPGGGYVLRGAGFSLNAGISAQNTSGTNTVDIILSLYGADQTYATTTADGALVIATNVNLNGHNLTLNVNRAPMRMSGIIRGTGNLTKTGTGPLTLDGPGPNTYTGSFTMTDGSLELGKGPGPAVTGNLTAACEPFSHHIHLRANHQLSDTGVLALDGVWLLMEGFSDTVGSLDLRGARVFTGGGLLTLNGNVTNRCWPVPTMIPGVSTIEGRLNLGSTTRVFDLSDPCPDSGYNILEIFAVIEGPLTAPSPGILVRGGGSLELSGNNTYYGTTTVEGNLALNSDTALGDVLGGTVINTHGRIILMGVSLGNESLTVNAPGSLAVQSSSSLSGSLTLNADLELTVYEPDSLALSGAISGAGGLTCQRPGEVWLSGTTANSYSGVTTVNAGTLSLSKPGLVAVPGPLVISDGSKLATVRLIQVNQIANTSAVRVNSHGLLLLEGPSSDTIGSLTLEGGTVRTETGTLTLNGDVTARAGNEAQPAQIAGKLSLGRVTRRFHLERIEPAWIILEVDAAISGTGGLTFTGTGQLNLSSSNSYAGLTTVAGQVLRMGHAHALGSTSAGTIASNGACLLLPGDVSVGAEALTLNGTGPTALYGSLRSWGDNSWAGPITLASASLMAAYSTNHVLTLSGVISGPGSLTKEGTGTLVLAGPSANTFADTTRVNSGTLEMAKSSGYAINGPLVVGDDLGGPGADIVRYRAADQVDSQFATINSSGLLDLNGYLGSLGQITLNGGRITTGLGTLWQYERIIVNAHTRQIASIESHLLLNGNGRITVAGHYLVPDADELDLHLIAPDGTQIELSTDNGKDANYGISCEDKDRTWFDDASSRQITAGTAPFVGRFKPESPLAILRGKSGAAINGAWKLVVADDTANGSTGSLMCWSLFLYPLTCPRGGGPCELCPSDFAYGGALTSSDPVQAGQLQTKGVASACGSIKNCPGLQDTLPRRYDAYRFANGPAAACIEVQLHAPSCDEVFSAAYHGIFQADDPCAGYLADAGSPGRGTYAFDVAANSLFTVVVSATLTNASGGEYLLRVNGGDCHPMLHIAPAGASQTVLGWTSSAVGYQLEGTPTLAPSDFQPVWPLPVVIEGKNTVTNPVAGPSRFYRLHKP